MYQVMYATQLAADLASFLPQDTYTRTGLYPQDVPFTNGCEGAGVVAEVGVGVKDLAVGDRVAFFEYNCAYATEAVVQATSCFKLPDTVSFDLGAALLVQGLTAHYLATDSFALNSFSTCLIHAAGGGTGALLVQVRLSAPSQKKRVRARARAHTHTHTHTQVVYICS
jgi:NADPH:quinone reductase-like Zn-dependent oxidoreductase